MHTLPVQGPYCHLDNWLFGCKIRHQLFRPGSSGNMSWKRYCMQEVYWRKIVRTCTCEDYPAWKQKDKGNSPASCQQLPLKAAGKIRQHLGSPPLCSLLHTKVVLLFLKAIHNFPYISKPKSQVFINYGKKSLRVENYISLSTHPRIF